MASALFDSLLASRGDGKPPPKISRTTGRMTMKFSPDLKYYREAQNTKNFLA